VQFIDEPALSADLIRARADAVAARLRQAAEAVGRDPNGFRLVAVTKGFGLPVAVAAVAAGLEILGENRVQEAAPKVDALPGAAWHLIGHLQSNKARQAVGLFSMIQSVDSLELLARLDRIAGEEQRRRPILLQVNVAGEATKGGFEDEWFSRQLARPAELVAAIGACAAVDVMGLMAMAPFGVGEEEQRAIFRRLREQRDALQQLVGGGLPELSMGMTADASAAVAEGSTLVRIGTAIFGPRPHA
jgi:pyridoxal phosphate enzyme (YggS family)